MAEVVVVHEGGGLGFDCGGAQVLLRETLMPEAAGEMVCGDDVDAIVRAAWPVFETNHHSGR